MLTKTTENPTGASRNSYQKRATRFEPSRYDACLSWRETGLSEEEVKPHANRLFALLLDISQSGAAIAFDQIPREGESVWLRLEGENHTDWTAADVVGVTTTRLGPHLVRLAFRDPCPFETMIAAICD